MDYRELFLDLLSHFDNRGPTVSSLKKDLANVDLTEKKCQPVVLLSNAKKCQECKRHLLQIVWILLASPACQHWAALMALADGLGGCGPFGPAQTASLLGTMYITERQ